MNIKNIKSLHVKIFEFNTETYYKKNLMPFNTGVNLDGLDASERVLSLLMSMDQTSDTAKNSDYHS